MGQVRCMPLRRPSVSTRPTRPFASLPRFALCSEQFDARDPLPELVRRISAAAEKVDADVRAYASAYAEKRTALTAMERKRAGNYLVTALEDVITPATLTAAGGDFVPADSEFLQTHVLVIGKAAEEAFLATYEAVAADTVPFGSADSREGVRGSPVVPRSAVKVSEDKEGYSLYLVTTLKKFNDAFRAACRERRWVLRDFTYTPGAAGGNAAAIAALEVRPPSLRARSQTLRCRRALPS